MEEIEKRQKETEGEGGREGGKEGERKIEY